MERLNLLEIVALVEKTNFALAGESFAAMIKNALRRVLMYAGIIQ